MEKVRKLIEAGSTITGAIKEALGMSVLQFAAKYNRSYSVISAVINGSRTPSDEDVAAFVAELGGTRDEWRELLHEAGRPVRAAS